MIEIGKNLILLISSILSVVFIIKSHNQKAKVKYHLLEQQSITTELQNFIHIQIFYVALKLEKNQMNQLIKKYLKAIVYVLQIMVQLVLLITKKQGLHAHMM